MRGYGRGRGRGRGGRRRSGGVGAAEGWGWSGGCWPARAGVRDGRIAGHHGCDCGRRGCGDVVGGTRRPSPSRMSCIRENGGAARCWRGDMSPGTRCPALC